MLGKYEAGKLPPWKGLRTRFFAAVSVTSLGRFLAGKMRSEEGGRYRLVREILAHDIVERSIRHSRAGQSLVGCGRPVASTKRLRRQRN